jgi:hypothetical protein
MFDLVNDIRSYPSFLHWCHGARIEREQGNTIEAELEIGIAGLHKSFRTRNTLLRPGAIKIDLAVLADAPIDGVVLFDLGLELGVIANRDVDLIDLRRASTVLRKEVVSGGRLAWTADAAACEAFAGDSMALYVALKDEQALALRGSGARGSGARGTNR